MKDLFLCLLVNMTKFGKLKSANFYGEQFSNLTIENEHGEYMLSISRHEKKEEENKDAQ